MQHRYATVLSPEIIIYFVFIPVTCCTYKTCRYGVATGGIDFPVPYNRWTP